MTLIRTTVPNRAQIGAAIRMARESRKETQTLAASFLGVTQASLSNYENGKRDVPGFLLIAIALRYLGGDLNALIEVAHGLTPSKKG